MNQKQPTPRVNNYYGISNDLHQALKKAFPSEFQVLMAVTRDGNVQVLVPESITFVDKDPSTGECCVIKATAEKDLVGGQIQKSAVPCDSQAVKDLSEGKVGVEANAIAVTIFENCGCICSGGGCSYWQC